MSWLQSRSRAALLALLMPCVLGARQLMAGGWEHSCAVLDGGGVKCWGRGSEGQLGYGTTSDKGGTLSTMGGNLPLVDLGSGRTATSVALGRAHSCALLDDHTVKCWGSNFRGQLGLGDNFNRGGQPSEMGEHLPSVNLGENIQVVAITAGLEHTCAVLQNHSVKCWGRNTSGQLGLGDTNDRGGLPSDMGSNLHPVDLGPDFDATAVAAGQAHTCALSTVGQIKCWGGNSLGQLGQGDQHVRGDGSPTGVMGSALEPVDLGTGRSAVAIAVGGYYTCALLDNGGVKCWGKNLNGQLGYEDSNNRGDGPNQMGDNLPFVDLGTGRTAVAIATGESFTCALLDDGSVKCWGENHNGQLGQGNSQQVGDGAGEMGDNLKAINVSNEHNVVATATGDYHAMALLADGSLKCWGSNSGAQLGLGDGNTRGDSPNEMGANLPAVSLGLAMAPFCQLGLFYDTSTCLPCPANTWALAQAASEDECVDCPAGKYSKVEGASSSNVCQPPKDARLHVIQSDGDRIPLRIDDEENDDTYFFVDQLGRVGINTNVYDEAEAALVVNGLTRLRGDVFLDDNGGEDATLQQKLARQVEFTSASITATPLLMQNGRVQLHGQQDACAVGSDLICADVSLTTPVVSGSETILLTVLSLQAVGGGGGAAPVAWVGEVVADVADPDMVGGFLVRVAPSTGGENGVVVELHWVVMGAAA